MTAPKRRKPERTKAVVQRVYYGHRQWVRGFACCVPGCKSGTAVQFCHIRSGDEIPPHERGGTSIKPHDKWSYPGCATHHAEQHKIGEAAFEKKYGISLVAIAKQLQRQSPHRSKWMEDEQ